MFKQAVRFGGVGSELHVAFGAKKIPSDGGTNSDNCTPPEIGRGVHLKGGWTGGKLK